MLVKATVSVAFLAAVLANPVEKRQSQASQSAVLSGATLLNSSVAYVVCLLSRGAFAAVIAIGNTNVQYPACAAYDLLHPTTSTTASPTSTVATSIASTTSSSFLPVATNQVGTLAFPSCPVSAPASCSASALFNTTALDTCCTNSPGGYFLQTQFWDSSPAAGPNNSWTIHGLWPDNCDGTYASFCDPNRAYTNISAIMQNGGALGNSTLNYMNTYWKDQNGQDGSFWTHEWSKHGTCMSSFNTSCYGASYIPQQEVVQYFARTVALFQALPTFNWLAAAGIIPSINATYTLAALQAVAVANTGYQAHYGCYLGAISEVWYGYTLQGNVANGVFTNAAPFGNSSCPATGIHYYPKGYSPPVVVSQNVTNSSIANSTYMNSTTTANTTSTSLNTTTH